MVALLLLLLLIVLGSGRHGANQKNDGILYQFFQRVGGGRAPKSPPG